MVNESFYDVIGSAFPDFGPLFSVVFGEHLEVLFDFEGPIGRFTEVGASRLLTALGDYKPPTKQFTQSFQTRRHNPTRQTKIPRPIHRATKCFFVRQTGVDLIFVTPKLQNSDHKSTGRVFRFCGEVEKFDLESADRRKNSAPHPIESPPTSRAQRPIRKSHRPRDDSDRRSKPFHPERVPQQGTEESAHDRHVDRARQPRKLDPLGDQQGDGSNRTG